MTGSHRTYGGVEGPQRVADRRARLLAAGLDLLGTPDGVLTVRGVCKESGLIARYFYESFEDIDALAMAVYEEVTAELVDAVAIATASDAEHRLRAGLEALVEHLAEDPRRGHVMFVAARTNPALTARRPAIVAIFADEIRRLTTPSENLPERRLASTARFLVGGFGEVLTSWQDGTLELTHDELVDVCVDLFRATTWKLVQPSRNR